jgi:hypothetical protein
LTTAQFICRRPGCSRIEKPLTAAIHYTDALRLIGQGLILHHDEGGDAVAVRAYAAGERLEAVKTIWNRMLEERREGATGAPRNGRERTQSFPSGYRLSRDCRA